MLTFSVNKDIHQVFRAGALSFTMPKTDEGRAWLSEAVVKALDDKTIEHVEADAWGYKCELNTKMAKGKKEVALLTVEELQMGQRGVADTIASYLDRNIDMMLDSSEAKAIIEEFLEMHDYLLIEEGVNLWKVLSLARSANLKMVDKLKELVATYEMGKLIEGVLKHPECLPALEGAMA
jgi:hypothetical protein